MNGRISSEYTFWCGSMTCVYWEQFAPGDDRKSSAIRMAKNVGWRFCAPTRGTQRIWLCRACYDLLAIEILEGLLVKRDRKATAVIGGREKP